MRYLGNIIGRWLLLLGGLAWLAAPAPAETMAEKTLKEIVTRQRDILAKAEKDGEQLDQAWLRGELQGVINSYDILIQKSPDFAAAYVPYGMLLGKVGMTKEAVAILLKANKLDPNIPVVKNQIAKHLAEDGKPVDALPWILAAIDLEPREPLYHYQLGLLLTDGRDEFIRTGHFTRAALDKTMLEAFQHAAEFAPDDLEYAYRVGKAYYQLETPRWDEALTVWTRLESRPVTPAMRQLVWLQKANVLLKLGRPDEARDVLQGVTDPKMAGEKQTLLDQMGPKPEK
jgi:tetratricopeptide (TPR) repeat protein